VAVGAVDFDIKPFALLDVSGVFEARYLKDEQDRSSDTTSRTFADRVTWEEELFISTKSYVYHPGFLNIDFGFGPKLVQQQFDSTAGSNKANETFLNLNARLNFLQLKSYPFTLYFQADNPNVSTGLAGRYLSEREEYGINAQLYQKGNTRVRLDMSNMKNFGGGFGQILDEEVDYGQLGFLTAYGDRNTVDILHRQERRASESGSVGLPIQNTTIRYNNTDLRTKNHFGSDGRHWLTQRYRRFRQDLLRTVSTKTDNQNYVLGMHLSHNERLSSRYDYAFTNSRREGADSSSHRLKAAINDIVNKQFNYGFRAHYDNEDQQGFKRDTLGAGTDLSYSKSFEQGSFGVGFSASQARTDQVSDTDFVQVFDEELVLAGTNSVALAQDFVVAESVVVKNDSQTQIFVEGFDYRLVVVGSVTSVQRLLGGNIQDGQTVLVDYEYQTSGTAEFETSNASFNVNASFLRYFYAGADFQLVETELLDGALTTPTNDLESLRLTAAAEFPVGQRWQLGVSASYWDRNEEIAPSVNKTLTVQAATNLWRSTKLNLSGTYFKVDQEQSIEDVDQIEYRVGISSRLTSSLLLTYDASYLEDEGGSLPRQLTRNRLDIRWSFRAVRFFLRASRTDERLGTTEKDYVQVTVEVARYFR
jgi:hypothetical protein